jgi:hypothetical protein
MRPPGPSLRVSGGDVMLGRLWLKPSQVDALLRHHMAALARSPDAAHHTAWLRDLGRVLVERTRHLRAAGQGVPSPLRGGGRGWGCRADLPG